MGGTFSGTGKGVAAASMGLLLKMRGYSVNMIKFDPYLGSASTLSPGQHGETYVTDDGFEQDLDSGTYFRLTGCQTTKNTVTNAGTLYKELIHEQEVGMYLGETIQSSHLSRKIQKKILESGKDVDIVVIEIGGTCGDPESEIMFSAIKDFKHKYNGNVLVAMVAPILWVQTIKEFKTKPLQNAVVELNRHGIQADILLCRVDREIPVKILDKVSSLTGIDRENVFDAPDVKTVYHVPIEFYNRQIDDSIVDLLKLKRTPCRIRKYKELLDKPLNGQINIGVVGKYENSDEAYISIKEALRHCQFSEGVNINITWVNAQSLENTNKEEIQKQLNNFDGIIVPGGFDSRGVQGKINAIQYARENKVPYLGICLGLQCAVIEFARNVCGIEKANSLEFEKDCSEPVVHYVKGQSAEINKSGTMRLGAYDCELTKGSIIAELYGKKLISERHRHRLEVNPKYLETYAAKGFKVSGTNPQSNLVEMMELDTASHPFFVGTQAHPEFKSRLTEVAPMFKGLVKAAMNKAANKTKPEVVVAEAK